MIHLTISDFASAIQLAATLNAAFVVVEYTSSFTKIIADKVCCYGNIINSFKDNYSKKFEELKIEELKSHDIDGQSTFEQIETIKRDANNFKKQIEQNTDDLYKEKDKLSNSQSFSFVSLYMFLYCILALFITKPLQELIQIESMWFCFTAISVLFMLFLWFFGEKKFMEKTTLKLEYAIYSFVISLIIATILGLVFTTKIFQISHLIMVIITAILPFVNFIVYSCVIKSKSVNLHKSIKNRESILDKLYDKLHTDIEPHHRLNEVSFSMSKTNNSTTQLRTRHLRRPL